MALPLIIAEAGVNHNGDLERAIALVHAAADAGADIVKFQAFRTMTLVSAEASTAKYQKDNTGTSSQADLLAALELPLPVFARLAEECRRRDIEFLCTAFDEAMLPDLVALGMTRIKIPSGELTNTPMLRQAGAIGLPVLLSTGMAQLHEVQTALKTLRAAGSGPVTLLHCTSLYPAPPETVNLRAMAALQGATGCPTGLSDHSLDDHIAIAAVALGAVVIEKHLTLDRSLPGPDHQASLEPVTFAAMVRRLREIGPALGDGVKRPHPLELDTLRLVRRSWHAARALASGSVIAAGDVVLKRPLGGLEPAVSPVGRTLRSAVAADSPIRADDLI